MIGEWNNGTGRRKSSVARVFLKKGSGKITVNGKDIEAFFGRQTSIMICKQPLFLTNHAETFDIMVNVAGGGESGQAGATRHGITRVAAVVSGLPLLLFPRDLLDQIVDGCFTVLGPTSPLIQFTYGHASPLPPESFGLTARRGPKVWLNIPPATVWIYQRASAG